MKRFFLVLISVLAVNASAAGLPEKGIVVGTAIQINERSASKVIGKHGIVMDTCRQLKGQPLLLNGRDGRAYQLADGIYESTAGIKLHVRNGGIVQITYR